VDGLELRVASIQAIADKERELKNTYIADRKKANEILCAYQRLLSREHGLESPANCADSATAVELVSALIADVNTIAYQYKEKLTRGDKKNIEDTKTELIKLKEENQNLLLELEKLRISKDGNNIKNTPGDQKPTEIDNFFDQLSEVFANVPSVEVIPVKVSPPQSSYQAVEDNSLGTRILKLAGESNFVKLSDLLTRCIETMKLPETEIKNEIGKLENTGLIAIYHATTRPPKGVSYHALFRLTETGLQNARCKKISELDRWVELNKGMSYKDVPLLLYAVEEFFPRHGYFPIGLFEQVKSGMPDRPLVFTPHINMRDSKNNDMYIMYEGAETRGESLLKYLDTYKIIAKGQLYILCPDAKTADAVQSVLHYRKQPCNITNIADWVRYETLLIDGNKNAPKTIWFKNLKEFENAKSEQ